MVAEQSKTPNKVDKTQFRGNRDLVVMEIHDGGTAAKEFVSEDDNSDSVELELDSSDEENDRSEGEVTDNDCEEQSSQGRSS